jgi:hypothetical protein
MKSPHTYYYKTSKENVAGQFCKPRSLIADGGSARCEHGNPVPRFAPVTTMVRGLDSTVDSPIGQEQIEPPEGGSMAFARGRG